VSSHALRTLLKALFQVDEHTITVSTTSLKPALALSYSDRRWIDLLTQTVNDTWDEGEYNQSCLQGRANISRIENPSRPTTHGYAGSEEFLRLQFEEYLLALLSCVKYRQYAQDPSNKALLSETRQSLS